jgi:hypothetical protein
VAMEQQEGPGAAAAPVRGADAAAWAECRLRGARYSVLRRVSCEYRAGVLTLRGRLPSYFLKQMAQALLAGTEGVGRIDNRIEVTAQAGRGDNHESRPF